ncbi:hypothetical protein [Microbacterium sp. 1.5R]|uniref:hypothetical protein n=1 Tax=Microbacterium sp. 1.5R TaxID=1916917 RepID=UPI0011A9FF5F|nr:hypothetical protein [Microbacterium sp. 1.5R]
MSTRIGVAARAAAGARSRGVVTPRGLWVEVEPGFHVGNDGLQYLGSITVVPGRGFEAAGPRSEVIGIFSDLDDAKAAAVSASISAPSLSSPGEAPAGALLH